MKKLITIISVTCFILCIQSGLRAQEIMKAVVTDPDQNPIAGALVQAIPGNVTTYTNSNGLFELKLPSGTKAVFISKIAYVKKGISIRNIRQWLRDKKNGRKIRNIQLQPVSATAENQEVVITGYAIPGLKNRITGAAPMSRLNSSIHSRYYYPRPMDFAPAESYAHESENGFKSVSSSPLSTFSVDVDKASYSNIRRFIASGQLPPADAVRTEEMINYFDYHYAQPKGQAPVQIYTHLGRAPWNPSHQLIQIGIQGKEVPAGDLPASNLVFLIDVSGSMGSANKLPLLITGFKMLTDQLRDRDRVAIVTYAGSSQTVLRSMAGSEKEKIKAAMDKLIASGSTNGSGGIEMAYDIAEKHFIKNGNNRVILATDGDFNVGLSSITELEKLIVEKRKSGIYLSVLGFGMGNYKDDKMEKLADKGNGNYAYIDNSMEARRVFLKEFGGTLFTIADDVKVQVEFNPAMVGAYRLIGYENRALADEDFNQDTVDAGEMGSGQSVTALYEIIPQGIDDKWMPKVDSLKYRYTKKEPGNTDNKSGELATIKLRYKKPGQYKSHMISHLIKNNSPGKASSINLENFHFAASVAGLGMILRQSDYIQDFDFDQVIAFARQAKGQDSEGDRAGFIQLAEAARALKGNQAKVKNPARKEYYPPPGPFIKQHLPVRPKVIQ